MSWNMNRKAFILLAFIIAVAMSYNPSNNQANPSGQLTPTTVYPLIDAQLKKQWWQYLRGAREIYRANVDQNDSFLFLSIYRNIVGTFLTITTWAKGGRSAKVNTLVRLGDGFQQGSGANYAHTRLNPQSLSFRLGNGEYLIDTNQQGQMQVNGEVISDENNGVNVSNQSNITQQDLELRKKCALQDSWIRENNWQYLRNALNIHRSGRISNERYYCVFNYVNIVGNFYVLASTDRKSGKMFISTFVRLGKGYETDASVLYTPADFTPGTFSF